ncbi:exo-alpha-sialidase [Brachyspira sp.]|uniref:sialidase family protein n=1 Tax=Brachyspira sp. TaxID=1977261 RepID=UPI00260CC010|nr:sialidase family protein [Brachyspira sp.]
MYRYFTVFAMLMMFVSCNHEGILGVSANKPHPLTPEEQRKPMPPVRTLVVKPGDYNSSMWRIVAIATADNGDIVVSSDARRFSNADLPAPMDTVIMRSSDLGRTWSAPIVVNPPCIQEDKYSGYGDPLLIKEHGNSTIHLLMAANNGFAASSKNKPIKTYISTSYDNGKTWEYPPRDITGQLWLDNTEEAGGFIGSGRGIQLKWQKDPKKNRRLMAAMVFQGGYARAIYSDDGGTNWKASPRVDGKCDEPKVIELADGTVMMNNRALGQGKRQISYSSDGGETWSRFQNHPQLNDPNNNGETVRYTSTNDGFDKNRLLFVNANHTDSLPRRNITVRISYDEGKTWKHSKVLREGIADYSSLTILPDGTIGAYVEEGGDATGGWNLYFSRFNLYWLTDGEDYYTPSTDPNFKH